MYASIDDNEFNIGNDNRSSEGRISKARITSITKGAKACHDSAKALSPVAGPKGSAICSDALDKQGFMNHVLRQSR